MNFKILNEDDSSRNRKEEDKMQKKSTFLRRNIERDCPQVDFSVVFDARQYEEDAWKENGGLAGLAGYIRSNYPLDSSQHSLIARRSIMVNGRQSQTKAYLVPLHLPIVDDLERKGNTFD